MAADLSDAIVLATVAHQGQLERAGSAYILHPLRVMMSVAGDELQMVAMLHDVVEDTEVTLDQLAENGFSDAVVQAVDAISKRAEEPYEAYIQRVKGNVLAKQVKRSDLKDNMDTSRLPEPTLRDLARLKKYWWAWSILNHEED